MSDPLHKQINRIFRTPTRIISDDVKKDGYTGLIRPVSESVWKTGEYLYREDGYYTIYLVTSYNGVNFEHIIFNNNGTTFRYVVEYKDKPAVDPLDNHVLNAFDVRDMIQVEMKNYKEMSRYQLHIQENIQTMMGLLEI